MLELIKSNPGVVAGVVIFIVGFFLTKKQVAWWRWLNETTFMAFSLAETHGIMEGWSGAEKLAHYLEIYKNEYMKKYGLEPEASEVNKAKVKASELAQLEKEVRLSDPFVQQGITFTGKANG